MAEDCKQKEEEKSAFLDWCGQWRLVGDIVRGRYAKCKVRFIERVLMAVFVALRSFSLSNFHVCFKGNRAKRIFIDVYVILKMVVLLALLLSYPAEGYEGRGLTWLVIVLVWYITVDTFNYVLCIVFVDMHEEKWLPKSYSGSMIMLLINYLQLIVGFAVLYLCHGCIGYSDCGERITRAGEAFYYSTVTITTLGYGDMEPILPTGRILSSVETLMGIVLLVLVFGLFFVEMGRQQRFLENKKKENEEEKE